MLLKVKDQNTKKYVRLISGFTFWDFIAQVKSKFGLPDATELDVFDETNTVVEEDIFSELIEASPDLCLTVRDRIPDRALDCDMASLLLLLHLPPPTAGQKRTKISPSDAVDKMLGFHKLCITFVIQFFYYPV
ncbi:hypothetical protein D4764_08G0003430 [Takifugu flavidus]|uniref:PB1 domain-containing protein n=1 Tax=Takifugu flavidus TaxID=433684 RepID=A0A5C6MMI0_9TELE|nr:hypothetical protein D4764_08G0003430 [Takifugu flavidus]